MKKKLLSILLCLVLALTLLPTAALAAGPTRLKSVDLTIELPKAGDLFDQSFKPTVTSFKSGNIDLLATGAGILEANWRGDYDTDANGMPVFRPGGTYYLTAKLMFNPEAGYCANYKTASDGWNLVMPDTFSATVNGKTATVGRNGAQYYPTVEITLTLEGEALNDEQKAEKSAQATENVQTRRDMTPSRTAAEAKTVDPGRFPEKIVIMKAYGDDITNRIKETDAFRESDVTTVIVDSNDAALELWRVPAKLALREVWVSDNAGVMTAYQSIMDPHAIDIEFGSKYPFNRADGTLFISESAAKVLKEKMIGLPPFTIKVYSGSDVYAAQKAGAAAAKDFCTNHEFTAQIRSADRVCTFATCQTRQTYYYSCITCGKCEYDPNHVAYDFSLSDAELRANALELASEQHGTYEAEIPCDDAYIGVNAAGQHVWWKSCALCGHSYKYDMLHVNTADQQLEGATNRSFAEYKAQRKAELEKTEALALGSIDIFPGTFNLPAKSDAKMSSWASGDVNLALNDDLLDTALLGSDYTRGITRLQFCSIAVRLAETLTGKSLPAASAATFTDTDNAYVLKAYAAGITTGTSATTFEPNATLNRQQMATFIYRTLRYVEKNSAYSYTDCTSRLASYSDSAQVQSWAAEAMAFMNALDLVKGTSATTLNPNGLCTIEQAIAVAGRSVYAHQLGWYQVDLTRFKATENSKHGETYIAKSCQFTTGESRIWVTGRRMDINYGIGDGSGDFSFINPYTGQLMSIPYHDVMPVRG